MKYPTIVLSILSAFIIYFVAFSDSVTLTWNPSADSNVVTSYQVHYGFLSQDYTQITNFGNNLTGTVDNLFPGSTYYFAATAIGTNSFESDFSNEINYTVPEDFLVHIKTDQHVLSSNVVYESWTNASGQVFNVSTNVVTGVSNVIVSWPQHITGVLQYKTNLLTAPWLESPTFTNNPAYFNVNWAPMAFFRVMETNIVEPSFDGVLYYTFNEGVGNTTEDLSSNNYDATLSNASWVDGYEGFGILFDGSISYLRLPNIDVTGEYVEILASVFPYSFNTDDARIISKATGVMEQDHFWMLSTINSGGIKTRFRLKAGGTTSTLIGNTVLNTHEWTHLKVSYDGAAMKIYVNDVLDATLPKTGLLDVDPSVGVRIGQNPNGYGTFDGIIDEVMIFDAP